MALKEREKKVKYHKIKLMLEYFSTVLEILFCLSNELIFEVDERNSESPFRKYHYLTSLTSLSADSCHSKIDKKKNHDETNGMLNSAKFNIATGFIV